MKLPLMRFSEIPYMSPIRIVIRDLSDITVYRLKFVKLRVFFPDDEKKRECYMIFPKWKLLNSLMRLPPKQKKYVGKTNVLIELMKQKNSEINIIKYERYID